MREIIFRGKRIDNGEWAEGSLWNYVKHREVYILTPSNCAGIRVEPSTVGQYIGLDDKNGKKIFEGDILRGKRRSVYCVEYSVPITSFVARAMDGIPYSPSLNTGTMLYYEVIGNIHDNPKLMEDIK